MDSPDPKDLSAFDGSRTLETIIDRAGEWVIRRDRGLTENEQRDFEVWLQADPRHRNAFETATADWGLLDRFPGHVAQRTPSRRPAVLWLIPLGLAAVLALILFRPLNLHQSGLRNLVASETMVRSILLSDGTQVTLNAHSAIAEEFTPAERGVKLLKGEAHFQVAKNTGWPFVVKVGSARVRAVGTSFNVHLNDEILDVLVTEGKVEVSADAGSSSAGQATTLTLPTLTAGQRVTVWPLADAPSAQRPHVADVSAAEIAERLAWQTALIPLESKTLAQVAADFERRTGHRIVLADRELAEMLLGGSFKPDDVSGFIHVLETSFGLSAERVDAQHTVLRKVR